MSALTRNEVFLSMIGGAMANPEITERPDERSVLKALWQFADMAIYHSEHPETPSEVARRWIKKGFVVVDTETTGLGCDSQIVEISIINLAGETLLDTLIKPSIVIPAAATEIHGITNDMVANAPTIEQVAQEVIGITAKGWIAYNAKFDNRMLRQCLSEDLYEELAYPECAMQLYAEHAGQWDVRRRKYQWHKLVDAAASLNVDAGEGAAHRALYDCKMTVGVIRAIAGEITK